MSTSIAHPASMEGFETYLWKTQQACAREIANAATPEQRKAERQERDILFWEADCSQKYWLTPSALAMIARLQPERGAARIPALPGTGVWFALDDQLHTNAYFSSLPLAASSYIESHKHGPLLGEMAHTTGLLWLWTLDISRIDQAPLSYVYHSDRGQWAPNSSHHCSTGRCERTGRASDGWIGWYVCEHCASLMEHWTCWLPVALMASHGDFAETAERREPAQFTTHEKHGPEHTDGKGLGAQHVTHTWRVISFDLSVKQPPRPAPEQMEHDIQHPTWLELAIANETVLYIPKHIEECERTFHHERYTNMRGKTITVADYDKRIPRSVLQLRGTLYRAIASAEQKG